MGLAELTSFSPKWTDGKSAGIMSMPKDVISDMDAYQANPKKQVDAGLLMLAKNIDESNNEFTALANYTQNPARAFKAFLRSARNKGLEVTADELAQSITALGLDLDPLDEARKANLPLSKKKMAQPEQMQSEQPAMQLPPDQLEQMPQDDDMSGALITSTAKQRKDRIDATFGGNSKDGDVPEDLIAYIKGLM